MVIYYHRPKKSINRSLTRLPQSYSFSLMDFKEKVENAISKINPKLEKLADGSIELLSLDEKSKEIHIKLIGGRLC